MPLLYHLVKKHFGTLAGIVAALVLAVTPVVFATDSNNTRDAHVHLFAGGLGIHQSRRDGPGCKQEILSWLQSSCPVVDQFSQCGTTQFQGGPGGLNQGGQVLYKCQ